MIVITFAKERLKSKNFLGNLQDDTPYFQTTNMRTEDTRVSEIDCSKSGKDPTCVTINRTTCDNTDMEMDVLRMDEDVVSGILQSVQNISRSNVVRGYNRNIIRLLCSSYLKVNIDINLDDKGAKRQKESIEGRLGGTQTTYSLRQDMMAGHISDCIK